MTTPATQSSSALGRRSLPSTFFESIQNARRYIDRRGDTDGDTDGTAGSGPGDDTGNHAGEGGLPANGPPENALLADSLLQKGSQDGLQPGLPPQPAKPMAFAEVARHVWAAELEPNLPPNLHRNPEQRPLRAVSPDAGAVEPVERENEISAHADCAAGTVLEPAASQAGAEQGAQVGGEADRGYRLAQGSARDVAQAEAQGLAHDANNLLSALRLYSELLCFSGVLHERHRHYAEDLKLLSLRSEKLIERLLLLAEQVGVGQALPRDAGGAALGQRNAASLWPDGALVQAPPQAAADEPEPAQDAAADCEAWLGVAEATPASISLGDTVRRISGVLGTMARGALEVKLLEPEELRVAIEEEPLERILVNLVANAAAAVSDGGAIRIRAGAVDGEAGLVALTVDDSGRGMSEAELAAAQGTQQLGTQPSIQRVQVAAERASRKRGLGLTIVRQLVAESGGSFLAYSQPGRGTRIEIRWERTDALARPDPDTGPHADYAIQSQTDLQAGSKPGPNTRPLPFVSWKNPARPSLAAAPLAGTDQEPTCRHGKGSLNGTINGTTSGTTSATTSAIKGGLGLSGAKGAVAC